MTSAWVNAGVSLVVAFVTALVTLVSGLLIILVAPILAVTGATLVSRSGRTRWIGVGMIAGVVVVVAGVIINRLAGE